MLFRSHSSISLVVLSNGFHLFDLIWWLDENDVDDDDIIVRLIFEHTNRLHCFAQSEG